MQFNIIEPHEINTIYYGFNKDSIFFDEIYRTTDLSFEEYFDELPEVHKEFFLYRLDLIND